MTADPVTLNTPKDRIALFVDMWSLFFTERTIRRFLDYRKLLRYAEGNHLHHALVIREAFLIDYEVRRKVALQNSLERYGYTVFIKTSSKPFPTYIDFKSEITVHAMARLDDYDTLTLATNDSCFKELLAYARFKNKKTVVIAFKENFSYGLLDHADEVKFITDDFLLKEKTSGKDIGSESQEAREAGKDERAATADALGTGGDASGKAGPLCSDGTDVTQGASRSHSDS